VCVCVRAIMFGWQKGGTKKSTLLESSYVYTWQLVPT